MMKTVLFWLVGLCVGPVLAQNEGVVTGLSATEFNGNVVLTWTIQSGNTCNGVDILHSTDSINFVAVGDIEGICGSDNASVPYDFTHQDPTPNQTNYYRLYMGGIGFSRIVSAEVLDLKSDAYLLRPHPVTGTSELLFNNTTSATFTLTVCDASGVQLHTATTTKDFFVISRLTYEPGFYFFTLAREGAAPKIQGRFWVP
jgi:hypothetical protein